jgi:hypothetical protein
LIGKEYKAHMATQSKKPAVPKKETVSTKKLSTVEALEAGLKARGIEKVEVWGGGILDSLYYARMQKGADTRLISITKEAANKSVDEAVASLYAQTRF